MTAHAIKHKHKPTATPPSTVIASADNHFLSPSDDNGDNDANPAYLVGKYDGGEKNKGKGGHRRRYRENNKIEDLHGLYEEMKDYDNDEENYSSDDEDDDRYWVDMDEKELEEDDDDDDDTVDITAVQ